MNYSIEERSKGVGTDIGTPSKTKGQDWKKHHEYDNTCEGGGGVKDTNCQDNMNFRASPRTVRKSTENLPHEDFEQSLNDAKLQL